MGGAGRADLVRHPGPCPEHRPPLPGIAVGIVQDGRVVYARGFGMMELGHREKSITLPQQIGRAFSDVVKESYRAPGTDP